MPIIRLENLDDPRLAPYSGMTDAQLRDCAHAAHGLFIGESRKVVERALAAGARPVSLFMEERWLEQSMPLVDRLTADDPAFPAFVATREQFHALTGYEVTRGALAAFERPELRAWRRWWRALAASRCWKTSRTTRTSGRSSARPRRSGWTPC